MRTAYLSGKKRVLVRVGIQNNGSPCRPPLSLFNEVRITGRSLAALGSVRQRFLRRIHVTFQICPEQLPRITHGKFLVVGGIERYHERKRGIDIRSYIDVFFFLLLIFGVGCGGGGGGVPAQPGVGGHHCGDED